MDTVKSKLKKNNFIVTGGAGFIGSHLVEQLIKLNNNVIVIDDLSTGYKSNLPNNNSNYSFISEKVQNLNERFISSAKGIFHLAAQASVPISIDKFYESSKNNLLSTLKVFSWAKEQNIPIIFASSSAIYGNLSIGRDNLKDYDILSPYAQDKLTMEEYASMMFKVFSVRSLGLRFFNVYGPRQDPNNPYSGVISIFIDKVTKRQPVTINGGYQTRDFIYVDDVVNVMIESMRLLIEKPICENINVGTGKSVNVENLFLLISEIVGNNTDVIRKKLQDGDPEKSSGNFLKLEKLLDLKTSNFTKLKDGLLKTVMYNNK